MIKTAALEAMSALSSGVRLDVYRLLVKMGTEGMVSSDIAKSLDIPLTNTSFHLKTLVQAKLAVVEQQGRFQRYRANIPQMLEVIAFLTENCCANDSHLTCFTQCSLAPLHPQGLDSHPK